MHIKYIWLPLILLSACEAQSDIQAKYMSQQSDCRDIAEERMEKLPNRTSMSAKQRNAALVDHFSTCMIKNGWHVARPVKNPIVPTPPGTTKTPEEAALPAQPLPGQPSNVITTTTPPNQSSPPGAPVKTETTPLQASPSTPALSQPATQSPREAAVENASPTVPASAPPATYQPSTPSGAPSLGEPAPSGLGRQF